MFSTAYKLEDDLDYVKTCYSFKQIRLFCPINKLCWFYFIHKFLI